MSGSHSNYCKQGKSPDIPSMELGSRLLIHFPLFPLSHLSVFDWTLVKTAELEPEWTKQN